MSNWNMHVDMLSAGRIAKDLGHIVVQYTFNPDTDTLIGTCTRCEQQVTINETKAWGSLLTNHCNGVICGVCLGNCYEIGNQGTTTYYRCRDCGIDTAIDRIPYIGETHRTLPPRENDDEIEPTSLSAPR